MFSEYERNCISERTKAALAYKKSIGVKLGAPQKIEDATYRVVIDLASDGTPYRKIKEITGVSLGMISKVVNNANV
jgi:DNA invertase Pin-like site-specific DNA recombinase